MRQILKKAKQLFSTSNVQISFTAQTAPPKFSLPPRRGLKLVWKCLFFDKINFWLLNEIDVFKQRPLENTDVLFFFDCVEFLNLRHLLSTRSASHDHKLSSVLLCEAFTELLICEKNSEKMNFLQCYTIKYSNISFNIRLCQYSIPFW